eukprot:TRINITY_DN5093_c0_g1_i1.p1 TRINITY_DN5093_c0_g1~~TRINITY_DN5093_c0_g1_i1.p1  ORF type:complete len:273 (-),score=48.48 TRINITY_DN5093_c0_g1_i1:59-877(-)
MNFTDFPLDPFLPTRAFDDLDDDEFTPPFLYPPLWTWASSSPQKISPEILLVGFTPAAVCFLQTFFPNKSVLASLHLPEISLKNSHFRFNNLDKNCLLYDCLPASPQKVLALICNYEIPQERTFPWTKVLFEQVSPKHTLVLETKEEASYIGQVPESFNGLRYLRTKTEEEDISNIAEKLESPNLITGGPAAIITQGQMYQKGVAVLVVPTDNTGFVSIQTLIGFEKATIAYLKLRGVTVLAEVEREASLLAKAYSKRIGLFNKLQENAVFT